MTYVTSGAGPAVSSEAVALLAEVLGVPVASDELGGLAEALQARLAALERLAALALDDVEPAVTFDPRWHG